MEQWEASFVFVLFFVISAVSNQVNINVVENGVECTYMYSGVTNRHYSTLEIRGKDDNQACDVISNDRCREQLINSRVLQITDDYPCQLVANTNTVLCLLDMDQVCEACCWLDDDNDCYPESTTVTSLLTPSTTQPTANVFQPSMTDGEQESSTSQSSMTDGEQEGSASLPTTAGELNVSTTDVPTVNDTAATANSSDEKLLERAVAVITGTLGGSLGIAAVVCGIIFCVYRKCKHPRKFDVERLNEYDVQSTSKELSEKSISGELTTDHEGLEVTSKPEEPLVSKDSTPGPKEPQVLGELLSEEPRVTEETNADHRVRRELPKPDVSRLPKELETQQRESLSFPCRQFVNDLGCDGGESFRGQTEDRNSGASDQPIPLPTQAQAGIPSVQRPDTVGVRKDSIEETCVNPTSRSVHLNPPNIKTESYVHLGGSLVNTDPSLNQESPTSTRADDMAGH